MGVERFTGPKNRERDLNELSGLIRGIALDGIIKPAEVAALRAWCTTNRVRPEEVYAEAIKLVEKSVDDAVLDDEERADLLFFCDRVRAGERYSEDTHDMQVLHGLMAGIAADGVITESELRELRDWLEEHEHLKGAWPFDEIDSIVTSVMSDQRIDADEHRYLMAFTSQFLERKNDIITQDQTEDLVRHGVCASNPNITFSERVFVVTGESMKRTRGQMHEFIEQRGGVAAKCITKSTEFLVVCSENSPHWVFSCYGRKIEQAVRLRRAGQRLIIVHEADFWDEGLNFPVLPKAQLDVAAASRRARKRTIAENMQLAAEGKFDAMTAEQLARVISQWDCTVYGGSDDLDQQRHERRIAEARKVLAEIEPGTRRTK